MVVRALRRARAAEVEAHGRDADLAQRALDAS
jgi:hypothetical protein